ncbi:kinase-like domain-containing protein [Rhizophagus irregularis DAOM 181602=DAOM 197198]|uniref:Kinase-like domain-containing protein n=1 Tax=Rhizophagus irregularis (strain DAOM 181602 / DAOM 197198 / MUCL 43194) TaxID=747089 RepID=A0A2P4PHV6_RHIID|nr:kinase-like domain-containing protein [Rhizophagus irregularis DAOM 181602=DAOM 197198]POG64961.1 kinase-like domain-containing protein [Rhizophagus irregularis DAOM 181602=DAOM 197198]|eukprot:XP_025171827.1 kinase-like domain-containing protein [Rhizophagus irregularis DAOM 181602=DAOM 197198]
MIFTSGYWVILKSLSDSSKIDEDFLNEWKLHLQCQHNAWSNFTSLIPLFGITQNPVTKNYMVVMMYAFNGSLRNNLSILKYNPNDKFRNLWDISRQLNAIHSLNLVHGDFHDGNLLYLTENILLVSDFGLCRLVSQPNKNDEICGVIPYIAPEVLRGKPYTKAADIYSFGIIMWEMTSGIPAYCDVPHDLNICLNICRGDRPEIIKGTMPEYVELMERCWDNEPEKRPTAKELANTFDEWNKKYPMEEDEEKRIPVPDNEPEIKCHPKSCSTSRIFVSSVKLNEILSGKTDILDEDLDNCMVTVIEHQL